MRKKFLMLFLSALALVFVTACGDDSDGGSNNSGGGGPANPGAPVVTVVPDNVTQGTDTPVTVTATAGYMWYGTSMTGGVGCSTTGIIQSNPATITVRGSVMSVGHKCAYVLTYKKDGYSFPVAIEIPIVP